MVNLQKDGQISVSDDNDTSLANHNLNKYIRRLEPRARKHKLYSHLIGSEREEGEKI